MQPATCICEINCLMGLSPDVKRLHIDSSTAIPDTKFYRFSGTKLSSNGLRKLLLMTVICLAEASLDFLISFGRRHLFGLHTERCRPYCTFRALTNRVWKVPLLKIHFSTFDGCVANFVMPPLIQN